MGKVVAGDDCGDLPVAIGGGLAREAFGRMAGVDDEPPVLEGRDADAASPAPAEAGSAFSGPEFDFVGPRDRGAGRERELGAAAEAGVAGQSRFQGNRSARNPQ